jgi:hypothetical protein
MRLRRPQADSTCGCCRCGSGGFEPRGLGASSFASAHREGGSCGCGRFRAPRHGDLHSAAGARIVEDQHAPERAVARGGVDDLGHQGDAEASRGVSRGHGRGNAPERIVAVGVEEARGAIGSEGAVGDGRRTGGDLELEGHVGVGVEGARRLEDDRGAGARHRARDAFLPGGEECKGFGAAPRGEGHAELESAGDALGRAGQEVQRDADVFGHLAGTPTDRHCEEHLVLVPVGDHLDLGVLEARRQRPFHLARLGARHLPFEARREARVAGIAPIEVPALVELEEDARLGVSLLEPGRLQGGSDAHLLAVGNGLGRGGSVVTRQGGPGHEGHEESQEQRAGGNACGGVKAWRGSRGVLHGDPAVGRTGRSGL